MLDQADAAVECLARSIVVFVPGCERGNDHAGVSRPQRRMRSNVSRTSSAVSVGSSISGIATTSFPRFCKVIGVAAISISSRWRYFYRSLRAPTRQVKN
jgi:hypothetical protein